jgi:hypothetical protein
MTREERHHHINFLELKAAFLGLQSFISDLRHKHICLLIDNTTAISYLNRKGGTHPKSLSDVAISIWSWCLERNLLVHAEHIPGVQNYLADSLSRKQSDNQRLDIRPSSILTSPNGNVGSM